MGQKLVLSDVAFTDTSLPILHDDPLLAAGSLLLFDPGHSQGAFAGVPGTATPIPNVAWKEAASVLGSGTQSSLALTVAGKSPDDAIWKTERSGKGGVHGIVTQAGSQASSRAWILNGPAVIRDYLRNNPGHVFYFSLWRKVTRPTVGAGNTAPQSAFHLAVNTSNYLFHMQNGDFAPVGGGSARVGALSSPAVGDSTLAAGTNKFTSGAINGITGTGVTSAQAIELGVGNIGAWATLNFNKAPSQIIYRAYIEDLTVSNRDFATVSALDLALFNAAFANGGKFYNDTYTDPATLP